MVSGILTCSPLMTECGKLKWTKNALNVLSCTGSVRASPRVGERDTPSTCHVVTVSGARTGTTVFVLFTQDAKGGHKI